MLIVLSAGARYQTTHRYVLETKKVENFISQLHVRGDSIRDGTSIVTEQLPFDFTNTGSVGSAYTKKLQSTSNGIVNSDNTGRFEGGTRVSVQLDIDITGIRIDGIPTRYRKIRYWLSGCLVKRVFRFGTDT